MFPSLIVRPGSTGVFHMLQTFSDVVWLPRDLTLPGSIVLYVRVPVFVIMVFILICLSVMIH